MISLPDSEKSLTMCLAVLTECTKVTDRQTHRHHMTVRAALDASITRRKLYVKSKMLNFVSVSNAVLQW